MFGLPYTQYVHGSALRTWNCVARFTNVLWFKFNHLREPIMPRSRRRHHSRSRSRSRSPSHDRDRAPKRRKVESYESPHQRRSVSSQPEDSTDTTTTTDRKINSTTSLYDTVSENTPKLVDVTDRNSTDTVNTDEGIGTDDKDISKGNDEPGIDKQSEIELITPSKLKTKVDSMKVTPTRRLTPKQLEKQKESEKKKQEKQKEREEQDKRRQDEKRLRLEQKQKEKEEKLKELEDKKKEKDQRRKEREEKEEQRRKEKEQEKLKRQQEIEEKTREKQKIEEQKQKAAAAFTKFFVTKKADGEKKEKVTEKKNQNFMPFEKKSDMKLAPISRATLSEEAKAFFDQMLNDQSTAVLYLSELNSDGKIGKSGKTWPVQDEDDDVLIIGESIEEEKPKLDKMRTKFLAFAENQRPPYYGTFRKKSDTIHPTRPFRKDENLFNYEVDSEEEWDDEGEGESLKGTDDEDDEENESDNDYEVDNKLFVPHGHLSDDEVDDEEDCKLSPESHKAKLKLLKNEFDEERKSKQSKLKPSVVGCIWLSKLRSKADETFDKYLQPFAFISNSRIEIKPRSEVVLTTGNAGRPAKQLSNEHVPIFLKHLHGSTKRAKDIVKSFLEYLNTAGIEAEVSQLSLGKQLRQFAEFSKIKENGAKRKYWLVKDHIQKKFNMDLPEPSKRDIENTKRDASPEK